MQTVYATGYAFSHSCHCTRMVHYMAHKHTIAFNCACLTCACVYVYLQMGHLPTSLSAMLSIKVTIRQMIEGSSKEANNRFAVHTVGIVVTAAL